MEEIKKALEQLPDIGKTNILTVAKKLLTEGKESVTLNLETKTVSPLLAISPRRAHTLHNIEGFVDYLDINGIEGGKTVVLADMARREIQAVLDDTAEHGFEQITFKPVVHPLFEPWRTLLMAEPGVVGLEAFIQVLLTHRRSVVAPDAKDLTMMLSQVRASKKITLHHGRGKHAVNGLLCETCIEGTNQTDPVDIPDSITIKVPLFLETIAVGLEIDLTLSMGQGEAVIVDCTSADFIEKELELFEKTFLAKIREQFKDKFIVGFGEVDSAAWEFVGSGGSYRGD